MFQKRWAVVVAAGVAVGVAAVSLMPAEAQRDVYFDCVTEVYDLHSNQTSAVFDAVETTVDTALDGDISVEFASLMLQVAHLRMDALGNDALLASKTCDAFR